MVNGLLVTSSSVLEQYILHLHLPLRRPSCIATVGSIWAAMNMDGALGGVYEKL